MSYFLGIRYLDGEAMNSEEGGFFRLPASFRRNWQQATVASMRWDLDATGPLQSDSMSYFTFCS